MKVQSIAQKVISKTVKTLATSYVSIKRPTVVAVGGSVGKTSSKLVLAHLMSGKNVSFMDDSYNNGLGLYLSVFSEKVPTNLRSPLEWMRIITKIIARFFKLGPEVMILEYGIDHPGDMDEMTKFIRPDIALLTAITPEHMEYMGTIEKVAEEETKLLRSARKLAVCSADDVAKKFRSDLSVGAEFSLYGSSAKNQASYRIIKWLPDGAEVSFDIDGYSIKNIKLSIISEPLIRQLSGAALIAKRLGVKKDKIIKLMETAQPAASRMMLLKGLNNTMIIDDTTNFSPDAGIESLQALKRIPATRKIAILGNMHELGEYADEGYARVAAEFSNIDLLLLVGEMSSSKFGTLAKDKGFINGNNLFNFDTSVDAGIWLREKLKPGDLTLAKGPFGGFYLEEAVKKLLSNPKDSKLLTRQSDFWIQEKTKLFGDKLFT